jgi:uncharacterized protein with HEPN domain
MRLESKKYLHDIAHSAGLALQFVAGKGFSDYVGDALLRSAVERRLQTAARHLRNYPRLIRLRLRASASTRIIAFRNILVHGYANIDDRVVWSVPEQKLPALLREAEALLAE